MTPVDFVPPRDICTWPKFISGNTPDWDDGGPAEHVVPDFTIVVVKGQIYALWQN